MTHFATGGNPSAQYVIATAHGNSSSGFGTQYCAWHSSTSSSYGTIAYTNLPYITDAGGAAAQLSLSTGTFPVQSLWSNSPNALNQTGCVMTY